MTEPSVDTGKRRFPTNVTGFLFAPVLWACYFVGLYSLQGAGCREAYLGHDTAWLHTHRFGLVGVMIGCALAMLAIGIWDFAIWLRLRHDPPLDPRSKRSQEQFFALTGAMVNGLFFVGSVWIGVSPLAFDACR